MREEALHEFESLYPFPDSRETIRAILNLLHNQFGYQLWMVAVSKQDKVEIMVSLDHGYNIREGQFFELQDTFCNRMICGNAPNIAPRVNEVPDYKDVPITQQYKISSYIGFPLYNDDGSLFGTLCAFDPEPQSESIKNEFEFLSLQARVISTLLTLERREKFMSAELLIEQKKSQVDELTGIYNRKGWEEYIAIEEERCQRYNSAAAIIIIDLDDLKKINDDRGHNEGDQLIRHAADSLRHVVRPFDIVARIGGDEFAVLVIEASAALAERLHNRIRERLDSANISASIGWAVRKNSDVVNDVVKITNGKTFGNTLNDVMYLADIRMYQNKENRKNT